MQRCAPFFLVLLAPLWGLLLPACDGSLDRAKVSLVGGYAVEEPYAFVTPSGSVTGHDPLLAAEAARRAGLAPIQWRQLAFAELFDELEAGRIDFVAAGTFITPERQKRVSFSVPTFAVGEALLVPRGNPRGQTTFEPQAGARWAVLDGSVEVSRLGALGWPPEALVTVPDPRTGLFLVLNGQADALVLSGPTLRVLAAEAGPGAAEVVVPTPSPWPRSLGALAFRPADQALKAAFDRELTQILGTPEGRALVGPFGFTDKELP